MPPAGIFIARENGGALAAPPTERVPSFPCTAIGVPACTATSSYQLMVNKLLFSCQKYPRRRLLPLAKPTKGVL